MTTQDYINEEIQRERDAQYRASAQRWAMQQQMQQAGNSLMQAAMNQASRPSEVILLRAKVRELTDLLAGERERCAGIAKDAAAEYDAAIKSLAKEETWEFAIDEMSDSVNERWRAATAKLRGIAERIMEGE